MDACQPTGQEMPVASLVWPLRSGSVVQSSEPTGCASTNMKSQSGSVSRVTQNESCELAGRHADRARQPLVAGVGLLRERVLIARAWGDRREEIRVDRVPVADAVLAVGAQVELADRRRGEVGRHRLLRDPHPGRRSVARAAALQLAVGHRHEARGDLDVERVGRLVERVVVDRIPGVGHLGLARRQSCRRRWRGSPRTRSARPRRAPARRRSATTVVKRLRLRSPRLGVTVSSSSSRLQVARRPLTLIERTVMPLRSRLKRDRFCVALALIVATP